jgi:hypothetical protein
MNQHQPYLKYFVRKAVHPATPVVDRGTYDVLSTYAPKIYPRTDEAYEEWRDHMIRMWERDEEFHINGVLVVDKVGVHPATGSTAIAETEARADFVRWAEQ